MLIRFHDTTVDLAGQSQLCQLKDCSAAKVKEGRKKGKLPDKTAAKFSILADFEQKGQKRNLTLKRIFPPLILSNSREVPRNIIIFTLTQRKIVFS